MITIESSIDNLPKKAGKFSIPDIEYSEIIINTNINVNIICK